MKWWIVSLLLQCGHFGDMTVSLVVGSVRWRELWKSFSSICSVIILMRMEIWSLLRRVEEKSLLSLVVYLGLQLPINLDLLTL